MTSAALTEDLPRPPITRQSRVLALVPHFRCEEWLATALRSLTSQTRAPDGIVVIDDCSGTPPTAIVEQFPAVTLLRSPENVGPYRLVQQTIEDTDYDAYLFQDADDWSAPERLERLLLGAERTHAALIGSDYLHVRCGEASTAVAPFPIDVNAALAAQPTRHALQHPTSLVARRLVLDLGGYASGMRFSGDDEFLRRAAHVARVRNVPRVLYYRRHRAESLTTASATGHGSPARRAVLAQMAERARENRAAVERGEAPNLAPLRRGAPIALEHVTGPRLAAVDEHGRGGSATDDASGSDELQARGAREVRPITAGHPQGAAPQPPVAVVSSSQRAREVLLWSLAQLPRILPVTDPVGLVELAEAGDAALPAAGAPEDADRAQDRGAGMHAIGPHDLRRCAAVAYDRMLRGVDARPPHPDDGGAPAGVESARHAARAPLGEPRRWAVGVPASARALHAILSLYPEALLVHVIDDVAPAPDPAGGELAVALTAEQAVGASRVHRLTLHDLLRAPSETMAGCLAFLGEPDSDAPLQLLTGMAAPADRPTPHVSDLGEREVLELALRGPGRAPDRDAFSRLEEAARAETPRATPTGDLGAPELAVVDRPTHTAPAPAGPQPPSADGASTPTAPTTPTAARPATPTTPTSPITPRSQVADTVALFRKVAEAGQTVAVISRGDPHLLELGDVVGWHFPQMPDGTYAGHHPGTSSDAIDHLESLRQRGADLLAIPATGMWWMEHYVEFRAHLERNYRLRVYRKDAGMVFDLRSSPSDQVAATAPVAARSSGRAAASGTSRRARVAKVQVLAWNVSHNPLGRAHLLAELLAPYYDVEIVGASFPAFGTGVWPPHRDSDVPIRTFPGGPFPEHAARMEDVARTLDGDALLVSKPRWPGLGLGFMAKAHRNRALLLDVDDRELAFVGATDALDVASLRSRGDHEAMRNPHGGLWTRCSDGLVGDADRVTVSNHALGALYGGTIIPHARDERAFDPQRLDRELARKRLGVERGIRLILFPGTPRRHKGIVEIARALRDIGDPRTKLCVIDTKELDDLKSDLVGCERYLHPVPYRPFSELPALLVAADLICALQDPGNEVARYQMPAKVTDALAMQIPCLVRPAPPLTEHIEAGRLEVLAPEEDVAERLVDLLGDLDAARHRAQRNREWFLASASYKAVGPKLAELVESAAREPRALPDAAAAALALQRRLFPAGPSDAVASDAGPSDAIASDAVASRDRRATLAEAPAPRPTAPAVVRRDARIDVVMFWKQNDTGLYGRRHDMLLRELVASRRVRRVVQFDHPIGANELARLARGTGPTHDALVHEQILQRMRQRRRTGKLRQHTFVHASDGGRWRWDSVALPPADAYLDYLGDTLAREGIGKAPTVFWAYPKNFRFPEIVDALEPDLVLADVVDDHRTWTRPGTPQHERVTRNYADIIQRSHVVVTNCEPMRREMSLLAPDAAMIPNGCDLRGRRRLARRPADLRGLPGPLIGYVGNLSARLDVDLLDELAARRPDWSFVFVGSTHAGRAVLRLDVHPNVHFLGPRPYEEARRYVRAFDVGLIPHLDNDMTRAMNPLKAFVYAAMGTPTVSTRVANIDELAPLLRIADSPGQFEVEVEAALAGGRRRDRQATDLLRSNSWQRRAEQVFALLDDALGLATR